MVLICVPSWETQPGYAVEGRIEGYGGVPSGDIADLRAGKVAVFATGPQISGRG
jgi:hypothetical protein